MPLPVRALCLVLVALVALSGVSLDLCACGGGDHGLLCAASAAEHEVGPAPVEAHGCCGGQAEQGPVDALTVRGADCACPVVAFEAPPSTADVAGPPVGLDPAHPDAAPAATADLAPTLDAAGPGHARAPPRAPRLRRHLANHVLRL